MPGFINIEIGEHITEALWDGKVSSSTIGETRTTMCM